MTNQKEVTIRNIVWAIVAIYVLFSMFLFGAGILVGKFLF